MNLQQPVVGIAATAIVMIVSLIFISFFDLTTFTGWVSYSLMCIIPMEIVIGVTWACQQPAFAAGRPQPRKGGLLMLVAVAAGVVVAPLYWLVAGGGNGGPAPAPMLVMCTIVSVIVTFWAAIMWGGWPFTRFIKNPVAAGITMLVAVYVVNYLLFRLLFNYDFMVGAPVYVPSLDPQGLFNAWYALVFYMSAIMIMFLMLHFDLWPLTRSPKLMQQPVLGLVWTAICLVLGGIIFHVCVNMAGMDVVTFLVTAPIPFIFGTIIVLNMLQASLFANTQQPVKGILSAVTAAVIGSLLALLYGALAPVVTGDMAVGPPGYEFEIWLASAMLAVTFPLLVFYAEFFQFWGLKKTAQGSEQAGAAAT